MKPCKSWKPKWGGLFDTPCSKTDLTDLDSEIIDEEVENVMGKVCEG